MKRTKREKKGAEKHRLDPSSRPDMDIEGEWREKGGSKAARGMKNTVSSLRFREVRQSEDFPAGSLRETLATFN